ncbi:MAG TPA: peptidyl-prolyl cis-trans isomerase, partial [Gammaproteobacteria bacterium]
MRDGEVRGPVRSSAGWHILRLEGIRGGRYQSLDAVRPQLVARLRQQRQAELEREHLERLVKTKPPKLDNQAALRKALTGGGAKYSDAVVARMGSAEVKISEVAALAEALGPARTRPLLENDQQLTQLQANLAARAFTLQEARLKNFHQRTEVAAAMNRARLQSVYASYVLHQVTPPDNYPDDAALKAYYRDNGRRFQQPAAYRLAQIFLADASTEGEGGKVGKRAQELARQAGGKNADFAALAAKHSEHKASAERGGEIGWATRDNLVREIAAAVGGAKPGAVVGPVRTAQGWHVLKLLDERPAAVRPYSEVRDTIRQLLRRQFAQAEEKKLLEGFVQANPIELDAARLEKLRPSL